ncbi:MAG: sigma D regulator [Gammaproteobacteria bacterium]|nr:sigma D regulator [Gammaproteobacteria bacterium]
MNTVKHPHFDRRIRTKKEIKQLIAERNHVLSQFYGLTHHIDDPKKGDLETLHELLQEFCQDLIDYIATGHFEIYRRIEERQERRHEILELSDEVFHKILDTTKVAINFNDLYDFSNDLNPEVLKEFPMQLSELGQNLAVRIELEDRFINTLLSPRIRQTESTH